jgi:hypothetical protein
LAAAHTNDTQADEVIDVAGGRCLLVHAGSISSHLLLLLLLLLLHDIAYATHHCLVQATFI